MRKRLTCFVEKPVEQVTSTEREQAKRLVYGIMYGMGPNSLSEILDVTKKEAKEFIDSFLQSYPEVNEFIEETKRVSDCHWHCN